MFIKLSKNTPIKYNSSKAPGCPCVEAELANYVLETTTIEYCVDSISTILKIRLSLLELLDQLVGLRKHKPKRSEDFWPVSLYRRASI
jgi:hypothetical protein